ncbi:Uncharacterized protein PCOAH_00048820 [Plasmodium coatneyi]|uniref:Protein HGH1 N-terminal domain-containing protein n=1 Tax=Plasmodium coatneyi TaxID=208452 RepID=A0A1B1E6Q4_9APIC|nr:Uncharacterized protein PCOAH_00048820 [Plasmodium coatneyi]ANQ10647.1 Uncharacterized protein PCOAH_00048820 [Plasmodium coatneyi]
MEEEEVNEEKMENGKGSSQQNDALYDELFSLICEDKDVVKREAFKILLGLIDDESMVAYIQKNEKKCLRVLISGLNSNYEVVALQCLVNLSAHIPKELIQRNVIEIVFDILREEEETEAKSHTELYILLVANLSREKEGIYKILDLPEEKLKEQAQEKDQTKEELAVSYYLNKLLHLFSKPIVPSTINKQITDKYFFISHVLINVSSVKECVPFFKSVFLLNMLSKQMLHPERCTAVLQCVINLSMSEQLHPYVFHEDCSLIPHVLSLVYTRGKGSEDKLSTPSSKDTSQKGTNKDPVHHLILDMSTVLTTSTDIKNRVMILLRNLFTRELAREKLCSYGIEHVLKNWLIYEKNTGIACDVTHLVDMCTEITPGCIYIE